VSRLGNGRVKFGPLGPLLVLSVGPNELKELPTPQAAMTSLRAQRTLGGARLIASIMQPKEGFSAHEVMLQLLSPNTQAQIQALTSGTSSSHNRVKTAQLLDIVITLPNEGTPEMTTYRGNIQVFTSAHHQLIEAQRQLFKSWSSV
jgi:hypothetical protein